VAAVVAYAFVTAPAERLDLEPPTSPLVRFGAVHVHTTRSDGALTPDAAAAEARRAGLSFLVLADHGDATLPPLEPRYIDGVLLIDAVELSVVEGHVLAFGLPGPAPYRLGGDAHDVIEDVHRLGGFAVVAHPDSPRADLRWRATTGSGRTSGFDLAGADGLEWINADSEWRDDGTLRVLQTLLTMPIRPSESLARVMSRPVQTLRRWDQLTRRRPVLALGGSDAHRAYGPVFGAMAQGVRLAAPPSGDAARDAAAIIDALRGGRTWTVITGFADPVTATLTASVAGSGPTAAASAEMGGRLAFVDGEPLTIRASLEGAAGARLSLWHDEQEVANGQGSVTLHTRASPGAYRAEATLGGAAMPWIITNPVYLLPPVAPEPPAPPPPPDELVLALTPGANWSVEHGPSSSGDVSAGPGRVPGVVFDYHVGTERPGLEYAAAAYSLGDGLESFDRLEVTISATAPMRVLVQFRLPGGRDGERWSRSVYVDPSPRPVTVRMSDVTPVGFQANRRPVVARVKSILFVVDTLNTPPGTSGRITLGQVRLARAASASGAGGQQQVGRAGQK
jgi:hypothetical protein